MSDLGYVTETKAADEIETKKIVITDETDVAGPLVNDGAGNLSWDANLEFEELDTTYTWSGPWTADQTSIVSLIRVGKMVHMEIRTITPAATTGAASARIQNDAGNIIPASFRPRLLQIVPVFVHNNAANALGYVEIDTSGNIDISAGIDTTSFTGNVGVAGTNRVINVTWST